MGNFFTLIVFDFDDTLFPTTFMSDNNYSDSGITRTELPPEVQQALDNIEQAVINALRESKRHGTVKIVSNGSMLWIATASARFMPQFWSVVRDLNIEVISANDRRYDRHVYSSNPIHWKTHEFRAILRDMKRRRRPFTKNITFVSIGDSRIDGDATFNAQTETPLHHIRFVKLEDDPSTETIVRQLGEVADKMKDLRKYRGQLNISNIANFSR